MVATGKFLAFYLSFLVLHPTDTVTWYSDAITRFVQGVSRLKLKSMEEISGHGLVDDPAKAIEGHNNSKS